MSVLFVGNVSGIIFLVPKLFLFLVEVIFLLEILLSQIFRILTHFWGIYYGKGRFYLSLISKHCSSAWKLLEISLVGNWVHFLLVIRMLWLILLVLTHIKYVVITNFPSLLLWGRFPLSFPSILFLLNISFNSHI